MNIEKYLEKKYVGKVSDFLGLEKWIDFNRQQWKAEQPWCDWNMKDEMCIENSEYFFLILFFFIF